ncbi:MAG: ATP-grasp domain-containing protein, partial [Oscillospiraceae bacterium]|nr:ATP-grasp domain-containing protein [Oscillospiraceae bacterium]
DALLSLFDVDLPILAQNRERFAEIGTKVVVSPLEVVEVCNDKWKTYQYLKSNGFDVPRTFSALDSAKAMLESGELTYPVIIKPRWGIGSMQIYVAENQAELEFYYNKARSGVMKSYLKYESGEDADNCILIQEMLRGTEYGLDVINDLEGNFVNVVCKQKYAMRAGETDCAVVVDDPALKSLGAKIGKTLGHYANLDVDVFMVDGKPYILEMNARFGGGYPFSHLAGIHLPKAIVAWCKGETPDADCLTEEIGVMGHKDLTLVRLK